MLHCHTLCFKLITKLKKNISFSSILPFARTHGKNDNSDCHSKVHNPRHWSGTAWYLFYMLNCHNYIKVQFKHGKYACLHKILRFLYLYLKHTFKEIVITYTFWVKLKMDVQNIIKQLIYDKTYRINVFF